MKKISKSSKEWKQHLNPEQYRVMFEHGTEAPFTGKYYLSEEEGVYNCAACGSPLFSSETKFNTGCGWPSFWEPISKEAVEYKKDTSHGMERIEVMCARCGAHLGHVFPDAPATVPGEDRFCINSLSLSLTKEKR